MKSRNGVAKTSSVRPMEISLRPRKEAKMKPTRPINAKPMQAPEHKREASGASSS